MQGQSANYDYVVGLLLHSSRVVASRESAALRLPSLILTLKEVEKNVR